MSENYKNGEISAMTAGDLDTLVKLHEEYINYGEGIRPHFDKLLRDPESVAMKYSLDGEIIGIDIFMRGVMLSNDGHGIAERITQLANGKKIYTADAVLVKREHRKTGVADRLCAATLGEMRRRGVQYILYELWVYPNGYVPARRLVEVFEKKTFLGRYENFYRDFHHFGYVCPVCGEGCVCGAEVYLAEL